MSVRIALARVQFPLSANDSDIELTFFNEELRQLVINQAAMLSSAQRVLRGLFDPRV